MVEDETLRQQYAAGTLQVMNRTCSQRGPEWTVAALREELRQRERPEQTKLRRRQKKAELCIALLDYTTTKHARTSQSVLEVLQANQTKTAQFDPRLREVSHEYRHMYGCGVPSMGVVCPRWNKLPHLKLQTLQRDCLCLINFEDPRESCVLDETEAWDEDLPSWFLWGEPCIFRRIEVMIHRGGHVNVLVSLLNKGVLHMLYDLSVHKNAIGDTGTTALAEAFSMHPSQLRRIDLTGNLISRAGAASLARSLKQGSLPALQSLLLTNNDLGDDGLMALADAGTVAQLKHLAVDDNGITNDGMIRFSGAIYAGRTMDAVTEIELQLNQIGDDGFQAFANALSRGALPSLRDVYVGAAGVHNERFITVCTERNIIMRPDDQSWQTALMERIREVEGNDYVERFNVTLNRAINYFIDCVDLEAGPRSDSANAMGDEWDADDYIRNVLATARELEACSSATVAERLLELLERDGAEEILGFNHETGW